MTKPVRRTWRSELLRIMTRSIAKSGRGPARTPIGSRLKVVCVGTGRDGSSSLCQMINTMFDAAGNQYEAGHEYRSREFHENFCGYQETGEQGYLDALRRDIMQCPYECIVGNGYAAILPMFADICGNEIKLVHLRRASREDCIASIVENCTIFPGAYRYYISTPDARFKRMAAFHFDEMSRGEWEALSLSERCAWYYDKTHALIDRHENLFDRHLSVTTETLNDEATRRTLVELLLDGPAIPPAAVLANPHFIKPGMLPPQQAEVAQWMLQGLNILKLGRDNISLVEYAITRVPQFLRGSISSIGESPNPDLLRNKLTDDIERLRRTLLLGLDQVRDLERWLENASRR
jgi:hypothetical protein